MCVLVIGVQYVVVDLRTECMAPPAPSLLLRHLSCPPATRQPPAGTDIHDDAREACVGSAPPCKLLFWVLPTMAAFRQRQYLYVCSRATFLGR